MQFLESRSLGTQRRHTHAVPHGSAHLAGPGELKQGFSFVCSLSRCVGGHWTFIRLHAEPKRLQQATELNTKALTVGKVYSIKSSRIQTFYFIILIFKTTSVSPYQVFQHFWSWQHRQTFKQLSIELLTSTCFSTSTSAAESIVSYSNVCKLIILFKLPLHIWHRQYTTCIHSAHLIVKMAIKVSYMDDFPSKNENIIFTLLK